MQNATSAQGPDGATLRQQIREQVRQSIEAAQHQAQNAENAPASPAQPPGAAAPLPAPGVPVVVVHPPGSTGDIFIPPVAQHIATEFFIMVVAIFFVIPIARAFARRIDKKPISTGLEPGLTAQLQRIENSVDSMAIEIERISEAQRYITRLQTERAEVPALSAKPPTP